MLIVRLKPRKEVPVLSGHPWIFSGAVESVQGEPHALRICRVLNSKGQFVCQGMYNPASPIAVRVLTTGKETVDEAFFENRLRRAIDLRRNLFGPDTTCFRLVNAEGDLLPGLVADIYGGVIVLQVSTPGMDELRPLVVDVLRQEYPACSIFERSDTKARHAEGLRPEVGPLHGGPIPQEIVVLENGAPYAVDVLTGDRTGFYLENRPARSRIASYAPGRTVLDIFSYSGSFAVCALRAGAVSATSVDSSAPAQAALKRTMELNKVKPFTWRHHKDDATRYLQSDRQTYGLVFLDAPSVFSDLGEYGKLLALAMKRVAPGGIMFALAALTAQFGPQDLLRVIQRSASSLARQARILEDLSPGADFPRLPSHPQGLRHAGFVVHLE